LIQIDIATKVIENVGEAAGAAAVA